MKRALLTGLSLAAAGVAGAVTSAVIGSRPDGVGSDGPLAPCGASLNCFRSRRVVPAPADAALNAAEAALRTTSNLLVGRPVSVERTPEGLRAVYQIGPFRDDVAVAVVPRDDETSVVYVRSAGRLGASDLGVNRRRGCLLLDAVESKLDAGTAC